MLRLPYAKCPTVQACTSMCYESNWHTSTSRLLIQSSARACAHAHVLLYAMGFRFQAKNVFINSPSKPFCSQNSVMFKALLLLF